MGEKLIDDLARALAQPMPRRKAVRVLGVTLAAVAIPGTRAGPASARRTATCNFGCGPNRTRCVTVVNLASGPDVCCRAPANRYYCGGNPNFPDTVKCVDRCPTGEPCTLSELDDQGCPKFACCKPSQECTNFRLSNAPNSKLRRACARKCRTIERKCGIAIGERCCEKDRVCCGTGEFKVCCELGDVCVKVPSEDRRHTKGYFKACGPKCKPGEKRCRLRCCKEITFETLPSGFKQCRCGPG